MVTIILKNDLGFSKTSSNREMISKNNFMLTLRPIKYKFYSLIGLNYIMHQHNILQIHLHPLNMHVYIYIDTHTHTPIKTIMISQFIVHYHMRLRF